MKKGEINLKKISIPIVLLLGFSIIYGLTPPKILSAQNQTKLKIEPTENIFYTNTTSVGTTFTISIIAQDIIDQEGGMYGWEFQLKWTPGIINITSEELNYDFWSSNSGPLVANPIDNAAGTYHQALSARAPSEPVTGTYWLANLTFQIIRAPSEGGILQTNLTLEPAPGFVYCLVDKSAGEIPHDYIHGLYKFISPRPPLPEITLKIAPPAIFDPTKVPCESFNINITIINAVYLHGFSLKLQFNSTTLECTTVQEGDLLRKFGPTLMEYEINNLAEFTFISINLTEPASAAEGNGTLATLTFHVLNTGDSTFHLYETELYDTEGLLLPHETCDGYFNNILMPKLFVDPPLISDPNMTPGSKFEIDIKVANVSDLYDFRFNLVYDTRVLNGLGLIVHPFNNATSYDLQFALNDTIGEIFVKMQYYPPAEPLITEEPVSIVTVLFQVQSYGATSLSLENTELSDLYGLPITHITRDGYVNILRRDVAITSVIPEFVEIYKGWKVNITVIAKNLGDIPETFNVTVFFNEFVIGMQEVKNLATNSSITLTFTFDSLQPYIEPCHNYTLKAEANIVPYEIDTTNNILIDGQVHIKLMGDINSDRSVNIIDAVLLCAIFGTNSSDPNWNPNADLNQDGYINIKDIVLLGINFGAQCT